MNGFEKRREEKKKKILKAAEALFNSYGIKKVTIKEIADKAGVSHTSIYNFFNSKDELASSVVMEILNSGFNTVESLLSANLSFRDKFRSLIDLKTKGTQIFRGEFVLELMHQNPMLKEYYQRKQNQMNSLMARFFEQGKADGFIDKTLDNKALFFYFEIFNAGFAKFADILVGDSQLMADLMKMFFQAFVNEST